jgi:hypothetical protein
METVVKIASTWVQAKDRYLQKEVPDRYRNIDRTWERHTELAELSKTLGA